MKKLALEQKSKEWHEYRKSRVMASEIPSIMGVKGAYKTRQQALSEKLNGQKEISPYLMKIFEDGNQWEEVVRNHLFEQGQVFIPCVVECVENKMMAASLDGLSEDELTILEVKSTSKQEIIDQVKRGEIPPVYYHQIQFQLFCSGLQECLLVVVKDGEMVKTIIKTQSPLEHAIAYAMAEDFLEDMKIGKDEKHLVIPEWEELANLKLAENLMTNRLKEIKDKVSELSEKILKDFDATHLEGKGIRIQKVERVGNVEYARIPELHGVNLDLYRKKASQYIKVELVKEKEKEPLSNESIISIE